MVLWTGIARIAEASLHGPNILSLGPMWDETNTHPDHLTPYPALHDSGQLLTAPRARSPWRRTLYREGAAATRRRESVASLAVDPFPAVAVPYRTLFAPTDTTEMCSVLSERA